MGNSLVAPCGMNCGICMAYLRDKNICNGCWSSNGSKSKSVLQCIIKNCELLQKTDSKFCYECSQFPCKRLKQLDKRYRLKYNMSMIENLLYIKRSGMDVFLQKESIRWKCETCGGTICVHRKYYLKCNIREKQSGKAKSEPSEN